MGGLGAERVDGGATGAEGMEPRRKPSWIVASASVMSLFGSDGGGV